MVHKFRKGDHVSLTVTGEVIDQLKIGVMTGVRWKETESKLVRYTPPEDLTLIERPLRVGDEVYDCGGTLRAVVKALDGDWAWICYTSSGQHLSARVDSLLRFRDGAETF